jgi:signal transduction histidine kinase
MRLARVCHSSLKKTWRRLVDMLPLTWQWILWALVMCAALTLAILSGRLWVILAAAIFIAASFFYALHAFKLLYDGAKRMSRGDLNTPVDKEQLMGGFAEFATQLNALADVAVVAAQKQMRSERMRAELITNVSHDIKTPLTSIINYVDLLQNAQSRADAQQYLEVLSRHSQRMKKLIDDLIELSKASTGNMPVDIQSADAVEYLNQAIGEFSDKLEAVPLSPIFEAPSEPVYMRCDGRLTWRVLSNLLSNVVKYALPGTRVYLDLLRLDKSVVLSVKNISREELNISAEELTERFVRGDTSRNTEGSGLGLNIAQSLMRLQRGDMEITVDGDLFKVTLTFPAE